MIMPLYLSLYLYGFWRIVPGGDQQYSDDMLWIYFPWPVILNTQMTIKKMSGLTHASAEEKQQRVVFFLIKLITERSLQP